MNNTDKLAYFFEPADLGSVFARWPSQIGLVLCLDAAGSCEMLLYHLAEASEVLTKAAAVFDRPLGDFAVVPRLRGLPTRKVLFSDEQRLLALVAGETDLPDMAADHLISYQYKQKRRMREQRPTVSRMTRRRDPDLTRWEPRLHLSDVRHKPAGRPVPEGYAASEQTRYDECLFTDGVVTLGRRGIRLIVEPEKVTARTRARRVTQIAFRDDFSRFVIPREVFTEWHPGDPLVIDMAVDLFPAGLQQRFALAPRRADITITHAGVFVAPGAEYHVPDQLARPAPQPVQRPVRQPVHHAGQSQSSVRAYEAPQAYAGHGAHAPSYGYAHAQPQGQPLPDPVPPPLAAALRKRRRINVVTPLRIALVALTGVGLMTGSVMRAVDLSDPPAILRIAQGNP